MGMYLRTTKRSNKDGSTVQYYQLAHNIRHPKTKNTVAEVVHNFGRADSLDRRELVRLCESIARVCGLVIKDPIAEPEEQQTDETALGKNVKQVITVGLGTVMVVEELWERLEIGKVLRECAKEKGFTVPYERALLAMTANRLCNPESKLGVWDRWLDEVYLPSCKGMKLAQMYEAMDLLYEYSSRVEEAVFFKTADLMNLEVDLVFYDTTTTSFSVDYEDKSGGVEEDGFRKFGHSKDGTWAPQVVVALAVTRDGVPVRSWVFPGNTADVTTIEKVKADLKGWKLGRALFVADSGMNSEDNRRELAKACGKYLLAVKMGSVAEVKEDVISKRGRYKKIAENLYAKDVIIGDGERRRRYILCYNPQEAKRQKEHREEVVKELEKELSSHSNLKATAKWSIELLASKRYKRYLRITKGGKIKIDRNSIREIEKRDGRWVLITNDDTISLEDAAFGYKGLLVIERCFRALKRTQIKMGPMYHWLPRRIEAHVKICVLALLIERIVELSCQKPWSRIRKILGTLQATEYHTKTHQFFQRNEPQPQLREIFKKLEISIPKFVLSVAPRS